MYNVVLWKIGRNQRRIYAATLFMSGIVIFVDRLANRREQS